MNPPYCDNPKCNNWHGSQTHKLITEEYPKLLITTHNQFEILGKRTITYCPTCEGAVDFLKQILAETKSTTQQHKL